LRGDDRFAERRKLERDRAVGIEAERSAVEHDLVLPAHRVEIDQRQAALDHARDRDVETDLGLLAVVGRAVRHQQDFAAGFGQALDHIGTPDVLANGNADANTAQHDRPRHRSDREHALLVEHAVVRQVDLVARGGDLAALEQQIGVVELLVLDPGRTDQHRRTAVGGFARQPLHCRAAGGLERRLEHEILGHIAGDEQLRENHQVGALGGRGRAPTAHFLGIAGNIADGRIELRKGDGETVGGTGVHGMDVARPAPRRNVVRSAPTTARRRAAR
jgi:hypothetical protein